MKNKFVKGLVALGLCAVSMVGLVGCALDENQQKALDAVVDSAENIVQSLDRNLELQNNKLSKEEAVDKMEKAFINFEMFAYPTLRLSYSALQYSDGAFSIPLNSESGDFYFAHNASRRFVYGSNFNDYFSTSRTETVYYQNDDIELDLHAYYDSDGVKNIYFNDAVDYYSVYTQIVGSIEGMFSPSSLAESNVIDMSQNGAITTINFYVVSNTYESEDYLNRAKYYYTVTMRGDNIGSIDLKSITYYYDLSNKSENYYLDSDENIALDNYGFPKTKGYTPDIKSLHFAFTFQYSETDLTPALNAINSYANMLPKNGGMYYCSGGDDYVGFYFDDGEVYGARADTVADLYSKFIDGSPSVTSLNVNKIYISNNKLLYSLTDGSSLLVTSQNSVTFSSENPPQLVVLSLYTPPTN